MDPSATPAPSPQSFLASFPLMLTTSEALAHLATEHNLRVSRHTLRIWRTRGVTDKSGKRHVLRTNRIGHNFYFTASDLRRFVVLTGRLSEARGRPPSRAKHHQPDQLPPHCPPSQPTSGDKS